MARVCGKPNCKCAKGEKHISLYISLRYKGKRKMIYVPHELEAQIENGIKTYKEILKLLDVISDSNIDRIATHKGKKKG